MKNDPPERISMPNMLIIAGEGRNVGKTRLACQIIRQLAPSNNVTAVKISSHFHETDLKDILFEEKGKYIILEEKNISGKDSSLMLQAGAGKVFFIMAPGEYLREAFSLVRPSLAEGPVVCESGGLAEIVQPGVFLYVRRAGTAIMRTQLLQYDPVIVSLDPESSGIVAGSFEFTDNRIIRRE